MDEVGAKAIVTCLADMWRAEQGEEETREANMWRVRFWTTAMQWVKEALGDAEFQFVQELNVRGKPAAFVLAGDKAYALRLPDRQLEVDFLGELRGGTYREVVKDSDFVIEFAHPVLGAETKLVIEAYEPARVAAARAVLRSWGETRPAAPSTAI